MQLKIQLHLIHVGNLKQKNNVLLMVQNVLMSLIVLHMHKHIVY